MRMKYAQTVRLRISAYRWYILDDGLKDYTKIFYFMLHSHRPFKRNFNWSPIFFNYSTLPVLYTL